MPGIIEWPAVIQPRVITYSACVMDLFPTVADIVGLPESVMLKPVDGISLKPLLTRDLGERGRAIGFRYQNQRALVDDRYKLLTENLAGGEFRFYDLVADPKETRNLSAEQPEVAARMQKQLLDWNATMEASFAGKDYPEGKLTPADPVSQFWCETPACQPYLAQWRERWEFESYLERAQGQPKPGGK